MVKWIQHMLLTSIHFSHHPHLDQSQRCFKSSRNPNSGRRSVPTSQGNQSLFLVVVNEFLKRGARVISSLFFPKSSCSQSAVKHSSSQLIFSLRCIFGPCSMSWVSARGGCRGPQPLMCPGTVLRGTRHPGTLAFKVFLCLQIRNYLCLIQISNMWVMCTSQNETSEDGGWDISQLFADSFSSLQNCISSRWGSDEF